jgi:hypothetical protein
LMSREADIDPNRPSQAFIDSLIGLIYAYLVL